MSRRKVCVVVTARPSYSRIKTAMDALRRRDDVELQVVVAGSALLERYGTAVRCMEEDGFEVTARVQMVLEGGDLISMAKTTGLGVLELATVFANLRPDVIVTVADRFETMATAIAGAYMNVPVAHVQGGEVTGSIDEKVRHAVTKLADLHLVASPRAAERVMRMGEDPATVFVTGCPSVDLAAAILCNPALDFDPYKRYGGVGHGPALDDGYLVVMQHPVTTEYHEARQQVTETLWAVRDLGLPVLWFWPNVDAGTDATSNGIRAFRESGEADHFHFFKNMSPEDFLRVLYNAKCLVGNSSVGVRECAFLGAPVVNVGSRQAGRDRGVNVLDVECERGAIIAAVERHLRNGSYPQDTLYGDGHAGVRIAEVLAKAPLRIEKRLAY
jgi:UDP-hydrolysing UDP-N-acetyl-D-glucosamine 2-epimerase